MKYSQPCTSVHRLGQERGHFERLQIGQDYNNRQRLARIVQTMAISRQMKPKVRLNPISIDLQLNLLNTWTRFKVADYYQNIVLTHLDEHQSSQAEEHIKKEIKLTLQRKSPYFKLERLDQQRKHLLVELQKRLSSSRQPEDAQELASICSDLKELRDINLLTAEQIIEMYNIYHCSSPEAIEQQMEYYDIMLENLDRDNYFLKESYLNQYINFDESYDPFLMAPYESIHRGKGTRMEAPIKDLFSMNISYAYRLMKTKNTILDLRSLAQRKDRPEDEINTSYRFQPFQTNISKSEFIYPKRRSELSGEVVPTERMTLKDGESMRIKPIQVYPSLNSKPRVIHNSRESPVYSPSPSEANEVGKLNFMKVEPMSESRASSVQMQGFPSVKKNPKYFLDSRANRFDSSVMNDSNLVNKKRSLSKKPSVSVEPINHGKYKIGVGQIYQTNRPKVIKQLKIQTQADADDNLEDDKLGLQRLKEINKQFINEKSHRSRRDDILKARAEDQKKQSNSSDSEPEADHNPKVKRIKYYNPIRKEQFSMLETIQRDKKYDYNPLKPRANGKPAEDNRRSKFQPIVEDDQEGLLYEAPISKYNRRSKNMAKNAQQQLQNRQKAHKSPNLVDQEAQTMELQRANSNRNSKTQPNQNLAPSSSKVSNKPNGSQQDPQPASKLSQGANKPAKGSLQDQSNSNQTPGAPNRNPRQQNMETLQQEDIIDERPVVNGSASQKPLLRSANQPADSKISSGIRQSSNLAPNPDSPTNRQSNSSQLRVGQADKKEIRMKVGKSTLPEVLAMLKALKLNDKHKESFDLGKLTEWVKVSQTYLLSFYYNDEPGIIALCSPIPKVGMALKLWGLMREDINEAVSSSLFVKFIEFVEKSTSTDKIMFSGKHFPQLNAGDFVMKKENLYERARKVPPRQVEAEFKPFLYIQCSHIRFDHKGTQKILYSEEIEEFTPENHHAIPFLEEVSPKHVPAQLQSLVKHTPGLADFTKVNEILTQEQFDNYQANELVSISNIDLMRFYLNTPLKSTFIGQDGVLKFTGTLVHDKSPECIVSVPTLTNNGFIYFCKNLQWASIFQLIKKTSTNKLHFSVMMFNKKLYGKMPGSGAGCYGNWQINLTWQDEMQGRIKHTMNELKNFGPDKFKVVIQIEKNVVFGFEVSQEDSIL